MSTDQQHAGTVRANKMGEPCPDWCTTDHAAYDFHGHDRVSMVASNFWSYSTSVVRFLDGDMVAIAGPGQFYVSPEAAADIADLLDNLAGAKPEDLRQLAALIRQSAGVLR